MDPTKNNLELEVSDSNAVFDHNQTQTCNMRWLRLRDVNPKLLISGTYNIGGTYSEDIPEFWFTYTTDNFAENYMLHLFITNKIECSFSLKIPNTSHINHIYSKNEPARSTVGLSEKIVHFKNSPDNHYNHLATFCLDYFDVQQLKNRELLIPLTVVKDQTQNSGIAKTSVDINHNFMRLLGDPTFSDFTIESNDGYHFKVHEAMLASRSQVFKAMLKEQTAESQNNKVQLQFCREEISNLIQFIYAGSIDSSCDCLNMLRIADLYDIPGLFLLVENIISQQINSDNAINLLILSDMYNSRFLNREVLKYISKNPNVLQLEEWKNLKDVKLIKSVLDVISN